MAGAYRSASSSNSHMHINVKDCGWTGSDQAWSEFWLLEGYNRLTTQTNNLYLERHGRGTGSLDYVLPSGGSIAASSLLALEDVAEAEVSTDVGGLADNAGTKEKYHNDEEKTRHLKEG